MWSDGLSGSVLLWLHSYLLDHTVPWHWLFDSSSTFMWHATREGTWTIFTSIISGSYSWSWSLTHFYAVDCWCTQYISHFSVAIQSMNMYWWHSQLKVQQSCVVQPMNDRVSTVNHRSFATLATRLWCLRWLWFQHCIIFIVHCWQIMGRWCHHASHKSRAHSLHVLVFCIIGQHSMANSSQHLVVSLVYACFGFLCHLHSIWWQMLPSIWWFG